MSEASLLRLRAQQVFQRLREQVSEAGVRLPSADALIEAAENETGMSCIAVSSNDNLLSGAHAVLDRDKEMIWHSANLSPERRRLILAHEFAHYWLHPDLSTDLCLTEDTLEAILENGQRAVGYSPTERREREANQFAYELLLPSPILRELIAQGWSANAIAKQAGLPQSIVSLQLLHSVLLPTPPFSELSREGVETKSAKFPLDTSQQRAAESLECPLLVEAGPGTGKTRTLTSRLYHLLVERAVPPENILALTFSNKAAEEMRVRLRGAVGLPAERVWIGTFHSFGMELLKKEGQNIGLPLQPQLVELADAVLLLERNLDRLSLKEYRYLHQPTLPFPDILRSISRAKDELQTPQDYLLSAKRHLANATTPEEEVSARKSLEVAEFYRVYQEILAEEGLFDFGDLIMRSVELMDACPDVQARWQKQYPHLLADEYQDINRASAQLLRRLAGEGRGFWAVGDVRQAIYRFRGASPANIQQFERDFPGGQRLRLDVNYRSTESLVNLFSGVATQMTEEGREETRWEAQRGTRSTPAITFAVADSEQAQVDNLVEQIQSWKERGVGYREQAILCRTNRSAGDLAQSLEERGVPVLHTGGLFERSEIKELLALLSFVGEPHGSALICVGQFPEYAVPQDDIKAALQYAQKEGKAFPFALEDALNACELSEAGRQGLKKLWAQIDPLLFQKSAWLFWTRYLFETSGYLNTLLAEKTFITQKRLLALYQLLDFARNLTRKLPKETNSPYKDFLRYLRYLIQIGEERSVPTAMEIETLDGVRLMTIHSSKGLEFPIVYLPNLIKGQFPPQKHGSMAKLPPMTNANGESVSDDEDGDKCLFFVALSRAKDHLYLSYPAERQGKATQPAPLLQGIAPLLQQVDAERVTWQSLTPEPARAELSPAPLPEAKPDLSLYALEQYQSCPRRYYYQRVLQLPTSYEMTPYRAYQESLTEVGKWMKQEESLPDFPTVIERWEALWREKSTLEEHPQLPAYREEATLYLAGIHQFLNEPQARTYAQEFTAELEHGRIRVFCEDVRRTGNTIRLMKQKRSQPGDEDHRAPELALLRRAAQIQYPDKKIEVSLVYPSANAEALVPEKARFEVKRIEKYDDALQELRTGNYTPNPDDRVCPRCPFYFVCPS
ncbi:DNA helicase [Armatimonadota bacterium]|nr:DNA helicase [Armatimonadota bacterium]